MKTHKHLTPAAFVAALCVFAGIAQAHHSFAMYDLNKTYVMTGVVVRVDPNPNHLQIFFAPLNDARDQVIRDGKNQPVVWAIEMDSAGVAAGHGITVNNFPRGTRTATTTRRAILPTCRARSPSTTMARR
jgi:hypothetical protein